MNDHILPVNATLDNTDINTIVDPQMRQEHSQPGDWQIIQVLFFTFSGSSVAGTPTLPKEGGTILNIIRFMNVVFGGQVTVFL